jgi:hypothetical protein
MRFSIAPLLIFNDAVPPAARDALRAATFGPAKERVARLESAARAIYLATDLDCREAREIVGLDAGPSCG